MNDRTLGLADENNRFSRRSIERAEKIYEAGFQISGGAIAVGELAGSVLKEPPKEILDIGCGSGGALLLLASRYGARGVGLDASSEAILLARERALSRKLPITFEVTDLRHWTPLSSIFDVVMSFDTLMYIAEKQIIFEKCFTSLRAGGTLFGLDYGRGDGDVSEIFERYCNVCNLRLTKPEEYRAILNDCGFENVLVKDVTDPLRRALMKEQEHFYKKRTQFVESYSLEEFEIMANRWTTKINFCQRHEFSGIRFSARKS